MSCVFTRTYWADVLADDAVAGSFNLLQMHELAWFPWLNLKAGFYNPRPSVRVLLWTLVLAPAAIGVQILLVVAALSAALFKQSSKLSAVLDRVVADVINYVNSAARATPSDSALRDVAQAIHGRFDRALANAADEGCTEIHVVAHSLGSSIAVTQLFGPDATVNAKRVSRLYTIGSPLQRVRFLWPRLFKEMNDSSHIEWTNFWDPFDLISNRLPAGAGWRSPRNSVLFGQAGLGRAHVVYEAHPHFIRSLILDLGARLPARRARPLLRATLIVISLLESIVLLILVSAALLTGFVLCLLFAIVASALSSLESAAHSGASGPEFWTIASVLFWISFALLMIGYFILAPLAWGRFAAGYAHYRHRFHCEPQDVCEEDAGRDDTADESFDGPVSAWVEDASRPWNRLVPRIPRFLRWSALVTFSLGIGCALQLGSGFDLPWWERLAVKDRIFDAAGIAFWGVLGTVVIVALGFFIIPLADFCSQIWGAFRDWQRATTTPPNQD